MLPQRKNTLQSGLSKTNTQRPFSILSLGLIGSQKSKITNKAKGHNDKKIQVKEQRVKIHDENHNYSNYISANNSNNERKCKDMNDTVFQKVGISSRPLNTTFSNLDFRKDMKNDGQLLSKPNSILLNEITNQMIEESEEMLLVKRENLDIRSDSVSKNSGGVVNLSKKIKKVQKPKHFLKVIENEQSPMKMQEQFSHSTERQQIAFDHTTLLRHPFPDREVIVDASIFRYKIINQRIDNDVDSEDEQIQSGIRRLQRCLEEAVEMNKATERSM